MKTNTNTLSDEALNEIAGGGIAGVSPKTKYIIQTRETSSSESSPQSVGEASVPLHDQYICALRR